MHCPAVSRGGYFDILRQSMLCHPWFMSSDGYRSHSSFQTKCQASLLHFCSFQVYTPNSPEKQKMSNIIIDHGMGHHLSCLPLTVMFLNRSSHHSFLTWNSRVNTITRYTRLMNTTTYMCYYLFPFSYFPTLHYYK